MVQKLLVVGLLSGFVTAMFAYAFAVQFSEPQLERAIVLEEAAGSPVDEDPPEHRHSHSGAVSRELQRGVGLFAGLASYCVALGGFVALGSAAAHARTGLSTRTNVWILVIAGYLSVALVPQIKYPASPPGVGSADTIDSRTSLFFLLLLSSLICMGIAALLASRMRMRLGLGYSCLFGLLLFAILACILVAVFPPSLEVADAFPRGLLLEFRATAAVLQLIIWIGLGAVFGPLASYAVDQRRWDNRLERDLPNA